MNILFRKKLRHKPSVSATILFFLLFLLPSLTIFSSSRLRRISMDVVTGVRYRFQTSLFGRLQPAPSTCNCTRTSSDRRLALSYIRTDEYLPLVEQMRCTLKKSNPTLQFALMIVKDELSSSTMKTLQERNFTLIFVDDLQFSNFYEHRFRYNWLKLRAFELKEYDAILLMDSDTVVVADISDLFSIPACFAASLDQITMLSQEKNLRPMIQGGVLFIRPCMATAKHMIHLLKADSKLRFSMGFAEQEFLSWYFRYQSWILPPEYDTMVKPSLINGKAYGLSSVKILHFTQDKPFNGRAPGSPGHEFLCTQTEIYGE